MINPLVPTFPTINDNCSDRLYVGGFSSGLSSHQIRNLILQASQPLEISIEIVENGMRRHRGFAFVQCRNSTEATILLTKFSAVFSKVNFAKRESKPADAVMNNISNVFVRGLSKDLTDSKLYSAFGGTSEGVVQCHVADGYGFVLFDTRQNAEKKILEMDGKILEGQRISVTWARPDIGGRKRKRANDTISNENSIDLSPFLKRPLQLQQIQPTNFSIPILGNHPLLGITPFLSPSLLPPHNQFIRSPDFPQLFNFLV